MMPMNEIEEVELVLGLCFQNKDLLRLALTHSSYANESKKEKQGKQAKQKWHNNERLELLGDSVLGFCVTEHLYGNFPERSEGQLSKQKSYVVSAESLAEAAREYNLGRFLFLGKGEALDNGRNKDSVLANAVEALIGACYLDQGMDRARDLVLFLLTGQIQRYRYNGSPQDVKLRLQEYVQKKYKDLPLYETEELLEAKGKGNLKRSSGKTSLVGFRAKLYIDGAFICSGEGPSKKQAEKQAAKFALEQILESVGDEPIIDEQGRSS